MEPLEIEEQSLAREVSGTVFEELQGISLDKSREDVTRSFALVGMQRVEARRPGRVRALRSGAQAGRQISRSRSSDTGQHRRVRNR